MSDASSQGNSKELDSELVFGHLRSNPDFFRAPEAQQLLALLRVPHYHKGHISLIEYQVKVLREQNQKLQDQVNHLSMVHDMDARTWHSLHQVLKAIFDARKLDDLVTNFAGWWQDSSDQIDEIQLLLPASTANRQIAKRSANAVIYKSEDMPVELENMLRSNRHQYGDTISPGLMTLFCTIQPASYLLLGGEGFKRWAVLFGSKSADRFTKQSKVDFALTVALALVQRVRDLYALEKHTVQSSTRQPKTSGEVLSPSTVRKSRSG